MDVAPRSLGSETLGSGRRLMRPGRGREQPHPEASTHRGKNGAGHDDGSDHLRAAAGEAGTPSHTVQADEARIRFLQGRTRQVLPRNPRVSLPGLDGKAIRVGPEDGPLADFTGQ